MSDRFIDMAREVITPPRHDLYAAPLPSVLLESAARAVAPTEPHRGTHGHAWPCPLFHAGNWSLDAGGPLASCAGADGCPKHRADRKQDASSLASSGRRVAGGVL